MATLSQANAAALDSLGVNKNKFTSALSAAEDACAQFIKRIQANIQAIPDFVNTGAIENLTVESSGDEIHIKGSGHILWQNYGVNGVKVQVYDTVYQYKDKRPPVEIFLAWIQSKNISMVHNPKYYGNPSPFKEVNEEKDQLKLAWAMATKVYNEGFKPRPIKWDEEKEKLKQDLIKNAKGFVIGKLKTEIYNKEGNNIESKGK
ncbi:hypothetical protein [Mucilaginibacter sp.]|uniref:hypothetical protein n=1 Tax=Mucilaginibacter sp. TaxID=1882438 RepID=UPI003D0F7A82